MNQSEHTFSHRIVSCIFEHGFRDQQNGGSRIYLISNMVLMIRYAASKLIKYTRNAAVVYRENKSTKTIVQKNRHLLHIFQGVLPGITGIPFLKCGDLKNSCTILFDTSPLHPHIYIGHTIVMHNHEQIIACRLQ